MNNIQRAYDISKEERIIRMQKFKERSLNVLNAVVKRRCRTIFIGSLDSIEKKFGYLWGFDKHLSELTREERMFLEIWKDLRKQILDKSNNQLQLLLNELTYFSVTLQPKHYDVHILPKE